MASLVFHNNFSNNCWPYVSCFAVSCYIGPYSVVYSHIDSPLFTNFISVEHRTTSKITKSTPSKCCPCIMSLKACVCVCVHWCVHWKLAGLSNCNIEVVDSGESGCGPKSLGHTHINTHIYSQAYTEGPVWLCPCGLIITTGFVLSLPPYIHTHIRTHTHQPPSPHSLHSSPTHTY